MKTNMNYRKLFRLLVTGAIVIALSGCIIAPEEETGSISLSVSGLASSEVGASGWLDGDAGQPDLVADTARVWLYNAGNEYNLGGAGFVEITSDGGTVTIEDIPEGENYSIVVVLGKKDGVFQPIKYAQAGPFNIAGGRETVISPKSQTLLGLSRVESVHYPDELLDESLTSIARVDDGTHSAVVAASGNQIWTSSDGSVFAPETITGANRIFSVTVGSDINDLETETVYVNTDQGVFPLIYNSSVSPYWDYNTTSDSFANAMINEDADPPADIGNTTYSGSFTLYEKDDEPVGPDEGGILVGMVVFYQRWGGLGAGLIDAGYPWTDLENGIEWIDIGNSADMDIKPFSETESPVRSMATSGFSAGYFSTLVGTFRMTDDLFNIGEDEEISAGDLLGNEVEGLTFFGVPYPGTTRPMRINEIALFKQDGVTNVLVGTPRGAYWFADSALENLTTTNNVRPNAVNAIASVKDENVVGFAQTSGYIAILTEETLLVKETTNLSNVIDVPARALVLGVPQEIVIGRVGVDEIPTLYVAGTDGLAIVTLTNS